MIQGKLKWNRMIMSNMTESTDKIRKYLSQLLTNIISEKSLEIYSN